MTTQEFGELNLFQSTDRSNRNIRLQYNGVNKFLINGALVDCDTNSGFTEHVDRIMSIEKVDTLAPSTIFCVLTTESLTFHERRDRGIAPIDGSPSLSMAFIDAEHKEGRCFIIPIQCQASPVTTGTRLQTSNKKISAVVLATQKIGSIDHCLVASKSTDESSIKYSYCNVKTDPGALRGLSSPFVSVGSARLQPVEDFQGSEDFKLFPVQDPRTWLIHGTMVNVAGGAPVEICDISRQNTGDDNETIHTNFRTSGNSNISIFYINNVPFTSRPVTIFSVPTTFLEIDVGDLCVSNNNRLYTVANRCLQTDGSHTIEFRRVGVVEDTLYASSGPKNTEKSYRFSGDDLSDYRSVHVNAHGAYDRNDDADNSLRLKLRATAGYWNLTPSRLHIKSSIIEDSYHFAVPEIGIFIPCAGTSYEEWYRHNYMTTCAICHASCRTNNTASCANSYAAGSRVCQTCIGSRELVTQCESCGGFMEISLNLDPDGEPDDHCATCRSSRQRRSFHSYSYEPKLKFRGTGKLYFGLELELSGKRSQEDVCTKFHQTVAGSRLFFCKSDSSIPDAGIEFVTHPFTLDWYKENKAIFVDTLKFATDNDLSAPSGCGIHIHTSKLGYAVDPSTVPNGDKVSEKRLIQRGLLRVQKFVYGCPKLMELLAGRNTDRWASLHVAKGTLGKRPDDDEDDDSYETPSGARETTVREMVSLSVNTHSEKRERYSALNFTEETVEFRIFKSTVDYEELERTIMFVASIIDYVKVHPMPKTGSPSVAAYRAFLGTKSEYAAIAAIIDANPGLVRKRRMTAAS